MIHLLSAITAQNDATVPAGSRASGLWFGGSNGRRRLLFAEKSSERSIQPEGAVHPLGELANHGVHYR